MLWRLTALLLLLLSERIELGEIGSRLLLLYGLLILLLLLAISITLAVLGLRCRITGVLWLLLLRRGLSTISCSIQLPGELLAKRA